MAMRAKFPAGSEQEVASIVNVLQSAGYTATRISLDEIELELPQALAEESRAAGCDERTVADTPTQPDSVDPNLPQQDYPEVAEREFVLAPLFRSMTASVSGRCVRLHHYLRQGLRQGWSTSARRLDEMGRALSRNISVCWGRIAQSLAPVKGTALQQRKKLAPPDAQKEKQKRPLTGSYRTADRIASALAGAVVMATIVILYLALTPHRPSPSFNLQAVQSAPKPGGAPMATRSIAPLTAVSHTLPKPSPATSNRRLTVANRRAGAEDSTEEVIVRQFPQRRIQTTAQQGTRPKYISDLDK
jgi:hypothetical protein